MTEIKLLSVDVINEIAAGEVIEKPNSVVKELIENSIDSKCSRVNVEIVSGGIKKILVSDDGRGIDEQYLEKAVQKHATSKMHSASLKNINSLGFRGEALYAIANASELTIISRNKEMTEARELKVLFGKVIKNTPAKGNYGTTAIVEDLFKKLPVRRKFLNTDRAEGLAIKNLIKKIALAYPAITFSFIEDGKEKLLLLGDKTDKAEKKRIGEIIGLDFLTSSIYISNVSNEFSIRLYTSIPTFNKANWQQSAVIINGRLIKDKNLLGVLKASYAGLLAGNRYPVIVLYMNLKSDYLDINVHPSKSEVRILNRAIINSSIIKMIRKALENSGLRFSIESEKSLLGKFTNTYTKKKTEPFLNMQHSKIESISISSQEKTVSNIDKSIEKNENKLGYARAQINNMFIVSQTENSLILVDQHAAHERIVLERLKKNYYENKVIRQILLIPEIIDLEQEKQLLLKSKSQIIKLGFIFDDYGDNSIIVREIPAILGKIKIKLLFEDLLEQIKKIGVISPEGTGIEGILSSIACHNSVRAGKKLNIEEMNAILRLMEETPNSGQCNHGRPTFIELKLRDVESLFGRV
jgi:DNA mismatch repair protein MutL